MSKVDIADVALEASNIAMLALLTSVTEKFGDDITLGQIADAIEEGHSAFSYDGNEEAETLVGHSTSALAAMLREADSNGYSVDDYVNSLTYVLPELEDDEDDEEDNFESEEDEEDDEEDDEELDEDDEELDEEEEDDEEDEESDDEDLEELDEEDDEEDEEDDEEDEEDEEDDDEDIL